MGLAQDSAELEGISTAKLLLSPRVVYSPEDTLLEPFTIQCSTCQSRIRVRNPKMVGQLANCPKCNSMIMVAAPQQITVEDPSAASVDSMAMTKDGIAPNLVPPVDEAADTNADSHGTSAVADPIDDEYRLAPEPDVDEPSTSPGLGDAPALPTEEDQVAFHEEGWEPQDAPLLPSDQWTSESSTKTRQYLLVGFLGATGIALAIVFFFVFLRWYNSSDSGTELAGDPSNTQPGETAQPNDDTGSDNPQYEDQPIESVETGVDMSVDEPSETTNDDSASAPNTTNAATDDLLPPANPPTEQAADEGPQGDATSPSEAEFPLDLTGADDSQPDELDPTEAAKAALPERLKNFAPVLDWQVQPTLPAAGVMPTAPPLTAEDLGLEQGSGQDAIADINWDEASQTALPGIILSDQLNLASALNTWTHLSGIPTVVDFDSVQAAGMKLNAPSPFGRIEKQTIAEAAQSMGQRLGLSASVRESRFLEFRAAEGLLAGRLPKSISVEGLVTNPVEADWLVKTLGSLFPQTKTGWTLENDLLSFDNGRVDYRTWMQAIRLVQTWRRTVNQPNVVEGFQAGDWVTPFVPEDQLAYLKEVSDELSVQSSPVGQTLSRLGAKYGVQVWIDWPNVGQAGLGPRTSELVITNQRNFKQILADYASLYSLVIAIHDDSNLWMTTNQAYRGQPQIYVLPSRGQTVEAWQQQLRNLTPITSEGVGRIDAYLTPQGDAIVIRCCRPTINY